MARRYVLTPRRRAALRKAQLASARKRRGSGKKRKPLSRKRKVLIGATVIGGLAAAGYGAHRATNVTLYHSTTPKKAIHLQRQGFSTGGGNTKKYGHVSHFSNKKRGSANAFGHQQVKITMKRKQFKRVSSHDKRQDSFPTIKHERWHTIATKDLQGVKVRKGRSRKGAVLK